MLSLTGYRSFWWEGFPTGVVPVSFCRWDWCYRHSWRCFWEQVQESLQSWSCLLPSFWLVGSRGWAGHLAAGWWRTGFPWRSGGPKCRSGTWPIMWEVVWSGSCFPWGWCGSVPGNLPRLFFRLLWPWWLPWSRLFWSGIRRNRVVCRRSRNIVMITRKITARSRRKSWRQKRSFSNMFWITRYYGISLSLMLLSTW